MPAWDGNPMTDLAFRINHDIRKQGKRHRPTDSPRPIWLPPCNTERAPIFTCAPLTQLGADVCGGINLRCRSNMRARINSRRIGILWIKERKQFCDGYAGVGTRMRTLVAEVNSPETRIAVAWLCSAAAK